MNRFSRGIGVGALLFFLLDYAMGPFFRLPTCLRSRAAPLLQLRQPRPRAGAASSLPGLRWYTSINNDGLTPLLGAALNSAAEFHPPGMHALLPHVVVPPGSAMPRAAALAARYNASVVHHEVLFAGAMRHHMLHSQGMGEGEVSIALASFMRVDAALLAAAESLERSPAWVRENLAQAARAMSARGAAGDTILYTDSDVLFLGPVAQSVVLGDVPLPGAFAVRRDTLRSVKFNPAVMLVRVSRFLALYEDMLALWAKTEYACVKSAWDQGCLNLFVEHAGLIQQVGVLPPELHTVPYDPTHVDNPPTRILHFHGPKPDMLLGFLEGAARELPTKGYTGFVTLRPEGYLKALLLFAALQDAPTASAAQGNVDAALAPWCKAHPGSVPC